MIPPFQVVFVANNAKKTLYQSPSSSMHVPVDVVLFEKPLESVEPVGETLCKIHRVHTQHHLTEIAGGYKEMSVVCLG
jgi:hypothetical protein